jgi:hypothetical protein
VDNIKGLYLCVIGRSETSFAEGDKEMIKAEAIKVGWPHSSVE